MKIARLEDMTVSDAKAVIDEWSLKTMRPGGFVVVVRSAWLVLEECRRLEQEVARLRSAQR